jgi:hypothetical protein
MAIVPVVGGLSVLKREQAKSLIENQMQVLFEVMKTLNHTKCTKKPLAVGNKYHQWMDFYFM